MSYLTENPDLMMEVLGVLVRRAGGSVCIKTKEEGPGPYNLLSKWTEDGLHLTLDENLTRDDVLRLQAGSGVVS